MNVITNRHLIFLLSAFLICVLIINCSVKSSYAKGNITKRAIRLPQLELDASKGFSKKQYEIETGVYYRWRINSDGKEEYKLLAPEFFRNSWIDQISIEDKEIKPFGLYAVEFDDEGLIDIWFVAIRPGRYEYYVEGLANQGFKGIIKVE